MDDKLLLAAFHNGVNSDLFIHKLYEKEPQSMAKLVHSTQNFINAKNAIIAKKREGGMTRKLTSTDGELVCNGFSERFRTSAPDGKTLETYQRMKSPVSV